MDASCVFRRTGSGDWIQTDVCHPTSTDPDCTLCPAPKATVIDALLKAVQSTPGNAKVAFQLGDVVLIDCINTSGIGAGRIWFLRPSPDGTGHQIEKAFYRTSPMKEIVPAPIPSPNHAPQSPAKVLNADGSVSPVVK